MYSKRQCTAAQALVARADVVASVHFEIPQKADDPFEREVAECKARNPAMLIVSRELQEQADRVTVAAERGGPQTLDRDQVVDKERMQDWPQWFGADHGAASFHAVSANDSNLWFAWPSKPGVIVR
jgi:hypothetical protein